MKKMRNLFMAFLMAGLVVVPTLNAEGEPTLTKLMVDGKDILSACTKNTENTETNELICNLEVEWNTQKVTVEATPDSESQLSDGIADLIKDGISVEANSTSFQVVIEKTVDDVKVYTDYTVRITKKDAPAPKLSSLSVKLPGSSEELITDFDADTTQYEITVPYGTTKVVIAASAPNSTDYTVGGAGEFEIPEGTTWISAQVTVAIAGSSEYYNININVEENPIIAEIEEKLAEKNIDAELAGLGNGEAAFLVGELLDDTTYFAKAYTVKYTEDSTAESIVADLEKAMTGASLYSIIDSTNRVLTEAAIEAIKNANEEVLVFGYDVIWTFNGSNLTTDYKDMKLKVLTGEDVEEELRNKVLNLVENKEQALVIDFEHSGNLPKGTKVRVFVDPEMFGDEELTLYYYNTESGKLNLVATKLKVQNDDMFGSYVEIELEHCSSYVLTTSANQAQTGVLNVVLYSVLALGSLAGIVFLLKKKAN